ncbi:MAG: hypothetical protein Q4D62_08810 [Planctomycetia bacterium]|nr:hypothetical protein [Planctomycetia bacterium]
MAGLLENPFPVLIAGILAMGFLIAGYVIAPRKEWLFGMVPVLATVTFFGVWDVCVVTPREEVEMTIDRAAAALRANDADAILSLLEPELAYRTRNRVLWALDNIEVEGVKISSLQMVVNELTIPPTAEVNFMGSIRFRDKKLHSGMDRYACRMTVYLERHEDGWKITNHEEHSLFGREY